MLTDLQWVFKRKNVNQNICGGGGTLDWCVGITLPCLSEHLEISGIKIKDSFSFFLRYSSDNKESLPLWGNFLVFSQGNYLISLNHMAYSLSLCPPTHTTAMYINFLLSFLTICIHVNNFLYFSFCEICYSLHKYI